MVEFSPNEEMKRTFVLRTLAGELTPARRKHVRIPVQLPVEFRPVGTTEATRSEILEIAVGGALIAGPHIEMGTDLVLDILPPGGAAPMQISGRVSYHTPQGTGVRFVYRDGGGSRRLRELIRRICAS
jgi:hypothetical protein